MSVERGLRLVGGAFVLGSLALGVWVSPWWFAFTAFVGLNLFQSGFTNWCPMMWILERSGLPRCQVAAVARPAAPRPHAQGGSRCGCPS